MTKSVSYCILIVTAAVVIAFAACSPVVLSDKNEFLAKFVGVELLNVLGVILVITLASAAQLHLAFNQIEEKYKHRGLVKTRAGVHHAAYCLIILFLLAVGITVIKPLLNTSDWAQTLFNGGALLILIWNVLILVSLTKATFAIKADLPDA